MESFQQTNFIEDLRDKHRGEEIWIIGCGSSLDDFPRDFFEQKLMIALNWAIVAFPECTYWHGYHEVYREYLRDEKPEFLWKSILLFPFPGPFKHGDIRQPVDFFANLTSRPIWMRFGDIRPIPKSVFEVVVERIMAKENCLYRASMTVAHTAIQAAAVMGAKRITMVGCEHRALEFGHARRRGLGSCYRSEWHEDPRHEMGTQWLAELLGEHGIEVIRYYYKDSKFYNGGYQVIAQ